MWRESERTKKIRMTSTPSLPDDDADRSATIAFLEKIHAVLRLAFGGPEDQCSLGLDPAVYSYGSTGKLHSAAYIACLRFAQELDDHKRVSDFTGIQEKFEDYLVSHAFYLLNLCMEKVAALGH